MKLAVMIPTYNERENIPRLLPAVLARVPQATVIVVDDDSPDGTGAILDRLSSQDDRIVAIHRTGARGYGPSCRDGIRKALVLGADLVVQMDADLSHDPAAIPDLVEASARYDLVIGSRYVGGVRVLNWPLPRLLLSVCANGYCRWITGLSPRDLTSGFRCWRGGVLARIPLSCVRSDGYSFLVEMTFLARHHGFRIGEVPITFVERSRGASKLSARIVVESLVAPWRLRLSRLLRS